MQSLFFFVVGGAVWIAVVAVAAVIVQRWRAGGSGPSLLDAAVGGAGNSEEVPGDGSTAAASTLAISAENQPYDVEPAANAVANTSAALLRYQYPAQQWAAPCVRGKLPHEDDFFVVECHELYDGGISFHSPVPIDADTLVISLGNSSTLVFMLARRLSQQAQVEKQPARWLVECQFIRRVREDAGRWARALKAMPLTANAC